MAIPYLTGYFVKPNFITPSGIVFFTDGTNDFPPNQQQCEAYGYRYDRSTGTCKAFEYSTNLAVNTSNENNNIQGFQNTTETGTNNTCIMGERNLVKGNSRNNIIIGDSNEIANGVNNSCVLGNFGVARNAGQIVFGGGGFNGAGKGYAQSSAITLTGTTTNNTSTALFVNGNPNVTAISMGGDLDKKYIGYEAALIGARTGGSAAGSVGDRIFLTISGIIYETTANESSAAIVQVGTVSGWTGLIDFDGSNMEFSVTGATNVNISWSCTLNLYEMRI